MKQLKVKIPNQLEETGTYYGECELPKASWIKPIAQGHGAWVSLTGKWSYVGTFKNNFFHGNGLMKENGWQIREGKWCNG